MKIIFLIALILFFLHITTFAQGTNDEYQRNEQQGVLLLTIPLIAEYEFAPAYFSQWIENHPQYTMIEAILDEANEPRSIQLILTEKETRKRTFYCNSKTKVELLKAAGTEAYLTQIDFKQTPATDQQPTYGFGFRDRSEQPILWRVIPASRPSERGSGLTPSISPDGVRLEYRELGTAVGEGTAIQIGNKVIEARPWPEISSPPYFVAYRGSVSLGRHIGNLAIKSEQWRVTSLPDALKPNAEWVLSSDRGQTRRFRITAQKNDELTISEINHSKNEFTSRNLIIHNISQGLRLRSLELQNLGQSMRITFSPELALSQDLNSKSEITFNIAEGKHDKVASGTISLKRSVEQINFQWRFKSPSWAVSKIFETEIKFDSNNYLIKTTQTKTGN